MRFGISATSLMCPKNLRTHLRPVNVCCAIVASHPASPPPEGEPSEPRLPPPSGLNFRSVSPPGAQFGYFVPISFFGPSKRKTTRGALTAPARHNHSFCGLQKARNLTVSQRLSPGNLPSPPPRRVFLLPSRYGAAQLEIRGVSPRIPTLFCVRRASRDPEARFLHNSGVPGPG